VKLWHQLVPLQCLIAPAAGLENHHHNYQPPLENTLAQIQTAIHHTTITGKHTGKNPLAQIQTAIHHTTTTGKAQL
jgi:hypothetical protein